MCECATNQNIRSILCSVALTPDDCHALPDDALRWVCDFGCGHEAIKRLKNGRLLCAQFVAQCPAMRAKNNPSRRGHDPFEGREHPRGMAGKVAWNRGKTWQAMYS